MKKVIIFTSGNAYQMEDNVSFNKIIEKYGKTEFYISEIFKQDNVNFLHIMPTNENKKTQEMLNIKAFTRLNKSRFNEREESLYGIVIAYSEMSIDENLERIFKGINKSEEIIKKYLKE